MLAWVVSQNTHTHTHTLPPHTRQNTHTHRRAVLCLLPYKKSGQGSVYYKRASVCLVPYSRVVLCSQVANGQFIKRGPMYIWFLTEGLFYVLCFIRRVADGQFITRGPVYV